MRPTKALRPALAAIGVLGMMTGAAFAEPAPPRLALQTSFEQAVGDACGADQQRAGVYVYNEPDFRGDCSYFQIDSLSPDRWSIGNDMARSVRIVGDNLTTVLWYDVGFRGGGTLFTGPVAVRDLDSYPCVGTGCIPGGHASSIMVRFTMPDQPPPGFGQAVVGGDVNLEDDSE